MYFSLEKYFHYSVVGKYEQDATKQHGRLGQQNG